PYPLNLTKSLSRALQYRSLRLYYQPIVRPGPEDSWIPVAAEALLRIEKDDGSVLTPSSFAEALNHPRLARSLGCFVVETGLCQAKVWQDEGLDLQISVNVSIPHLLDPRFLEDIERLVIRPSQVSPKTLTLEVTESAQIKDLDQASEALQQCQRWGMQISLDDFGTGYASLTYLQKIPVNTIKIDQSFIRDILAYEKDRAIVYGILAAASKMGVLVVAEGVESPAHAGLLCAMNCPLLQGYWMAKPMRADNFTKWIRRVGGAFKS
ncbi:EAL domain-containing protein, partial [Acidithiobacillus caldus]|uniref:EAL domain-containing protein n=1 Tax=Acidithiobacillus caldus TaxID=33059 RepID=UPI001C06FC97